MELTTITLYIVVGVTLTICAIIAGAVYMHSRAARTSEMLDMVKELAEMGHDLKRIRHQMDRESILLSGSLKELDSYICTLRREADRLEQLKQERAETSTEKSTARA